MDSLLWGLEPKIEDFWDQDQSGNNPKSAPPPKWDVVLQQTDQIIAWISEDSWNSFYVDLVDVSEIKKPRHKCGLASFFGKEVGLAVDGEILDLPSLLCFQEMFKTVWAMLLMWADFPGWNWFSFPPLCAQLWKVLPLELTLKLGGGMGSENKVSGMRMKLLCSECFFLRNKSKMRFNPKYSTPPLAAVGAKGESKEFF